MDSERELDSLKCDLLTVGTAGNVKDLEQRLRRWEWRAHLFRKMKANYEQAGKCISIPKYYFTEILWQY